MATIKIPNNKSKVDPQLKPGPVPEEAKPGKGEEVKANAAELSGAEAVAASVGLGTALKSASAVDANPATAADPSKPGGESGLTAYGSDAVKNETAGYAVGYGKPPVQHQFKPGQSGNPKGGKKTMKSLHDALYTQLSKKMTVVQNGKASKVPTTDALALSLIKGALSGKASFMNKVIDLMESIAARQARVGAGDVHNFSWKEEHEHMWRLLQAETEDADEEDEDDDDGNGAPAPAAP